MSILPLPKKGPQGLPSLLPACTSVSLDAESATFSSMHLAECRPDPRQKLRVCSITAGVGPKEKLLSGPGRPSPRTHPPSVPLCRLLASHPPADLSQPELPGDLSVYNGPPSSNLRHQAKGLKRDPAPQLLHTHCLELLTRTCHT